MTSLVKVNFIMIPEKINYKTEKYGRIGRIEIEFEHYKSN